MNSVSNIDNSHNFWWEGFEGKAFFFVAISNGDEKLSSFDINQQSVISICSCGTIVNRYDSELDFRHIGDM